MVFQQKEIRKIDICYLCGRKLSDDCTDDDDDHVPPKQFFAKSIRKIHNPNLLTLPTHKTCNSCYKLDEDYFADSLAPVVSKSYSGKALWDNVLNRYIEEPRRRKLGERIYKEFNRRPGGIVLPAGKIVKTFDAERIDRIIWKITRGLFFYETWRFLPKDKLEGVERFFEELPPELGEIFRGAKSSRGRYPAVFDYIYVESTEKNPHLWGWAMRFWETLISVTYFHDPECSCEYCRERIQ